MILKILFSLIMFFCFAEVLYSNQKNQFADNLLNGVSAEIDPDLSPYYKNRSAESIASEVEANGFTAVHYVVTNLENVNIELINELHKRKIGVWACVFATSLYGPKDNFPPDWKKWMMEFTNQDSQEYTHLSFIYNDYREWMRANLVKMINKYPFDGFVFMETHFPVFGKLDNPTASYCDISKGFQEKFQTVTGNKDFPDFKNPEDKNYYKKNPELFKALVEFRIKEINDFYDYIINSKEGLRKVFPNLIIGTWTVALSSAGGMELLRTWEGQDAAAMVDKVKPDIHFFQTHWPDWIRADLPPDYLKQYKPYVDSVKKVQPGISIGAQGDIGSLDFMRKTDKWQSDFVRESKAAGINTTTIYEFILRWKMYHSAPELKKAVKSGDNSVKLIFDQVVDKSSAEKMKGKKISDYSGNKKIGITDVKTDGNIVILTTDEPLPENEILSYPTAGLSDCPNLRFAINQKGNTPEEKYGKANAIPGNIFEFAKTEKE